MPTTVGWYHISGNIGGNLWHGLNKWSSFCILGGEDVTITIGVDQARNKLMYYDAVAQTFKEIALATTT